MSQKVMIGRLAQLPFPLDWDSIDGEFNQYVTPQPQSEHDNQEGADDETPHHSVPLPNLTDLFGGSFKWLAQMIGGRLPEGTNHIGAFEVECPLPGWPHPCCHELIMIQPSCGDGQFRKP
jgi:hypothetical protein